MEGYSKINSGGHIMSVIDLWAERHIQEALSKGAFKFKWGGKCYSLKMIV